MEPIVSDAILANLGDAARIIDLPVDQVILLAQDERIAIDFTASIIAGDHEAFLATIDWDDLRHRMHADIDAIVDDVVAAPIPQASTVKIRF